jgi:methylglutaconyl-CoA hydratase
MPEECGWRMNAEKTVAVITLNRPAAKNAIDDKLTAGLELSIRRVLATKSLRVVFLTGNGAMFCAGGDPKSFQAAKAAADAAKATGAPSMNDASAGEFANLLHALNSLPVYVVGLANGSAMGGGFGFLCCCDTVIARRGCFFALSEVKLGVIPATISPYVVAKIGPSNARRLFMTGETLNVDKAVAIGLVQEVVDTIPALAQEAQKVCEVMKLAAPGAVAAAKALVRNVQYQPITAELQAYTAKQLAEVRSSDESVGGMAAVQAGQKPPWAASPLTFPQA